MTAAEPLGCTLSAYEHSKGASKRFMMAGLMMNGRLF
jgi:hypothetical protein